MAVIPPRSQNFIDYIYIDDHDGSYSRLIKRPNQLSFNSSQKEFISHDMQPFDFAKQYNKIVDNCSTTKEPNINNEIYKFQPRTIHPDKLKIPKYFLTMKSRSNGRAQRLYSTPFDVKGGEQKEQNYMVENKILEQNKDVNQKQLSKQMQIKQRQSIQEDEFVVNYTKLFINTQNKLLFDKQNQIRFSSLGKQRQDCMKIYDELKREQQQIWVDKIERKAANKQSGQNKKGIGQYFSGSSTENLANLENSLNTPSPTQNKTNYQTFINNKTQSNSMSNIPNTNSSKSMTNLQKIMAQLTTPKRDFFFTSNINFSQKKDKFVNKILHNVSSLKSLDEDSIIKSASKQIQSNLKQKKINFAHHRSKSVIVDRHSRQQSISQNYYTPLYQRKEFETFSQSLGNYSNNELIFQSPPNFSSLKSTKIPKLKTNSSSEALNSNYTKQYGKINNLNYSQDEDEFSYSYANNKNQFQSIQYSTPSLLDSSKDTAEDYDNKIINNMKQIIKKLNTSQQDEAIQIKQNSDDIQENQSPENNTGLKQENSISIKQFDRHKAIFNFLTKKKLPQQDIKTEPCQHSPLVKQQQYFTFNNHIPKNQAQINSKIIEKLNNFQKSVQDNQAFFQDTRGLNIKKQKSPTVKFGLSQEAQKKINEYQIRAKQQFRTIKI
ncbi:hypothetical protein TTHERM_00440540 (macronuclear) [Tetrahymena thermophila SB210]|uniref:Uncharacterized protein n=1 Tax=Tetrahymena thermophila (strain SB210) TaxID=312017 RepID=I7MEU2_TETTS|nr:hypothetical protein TTHERM_00440540 [Tetrahymena thermophila SB210]EAR97604.2 hypothetical protein TTHERM_00440540 [Tetrahymena thermophila SB210]|eukprot:XP_001017849.2 hypothetical protein TTHERM_00440540 [Tetrahymena thermophila SB210]